MNYGPIRTFQTCDVFKAIGSIVVSDWAILVALLDTGPVRCSVSPSILSANFAKLGEQVSVCHKVLGSVC